MMNTHAGTFTPAQEFLDMLLVHCPRLVVRASRDILLNFLRLLSRVGGPAGMVTGLSLVAAEHVGDADIDITFCK